MMRGIFKRSNNNPILKPNEAWWKVYNPGAIKDSLGIFHLFPRVMKREEDWHSRIAHAISKDGENFEWTDNISISRENKTSELRGVEDPRITFIDGRYHIVYAVYDGKSVLLYSAVTNVLSGDWIKNGPMLPHFDFFKNGAKAISWKKGKPVEKVRDKNYVWNKSGALFSKKYNNEFLLIFGEYYIWLASSKDGVNYEVKNKEPILGPRKNTNNFDNTFIETGPPPIYTDKGWIFLYHGIDEAFRYQIGFVILDLNDPSKILYRSEEPIFGPEMDYEIGDKLIDVISGGIDAITKLNDEELKDFYKKARNENIIPQVTFCTGAILEEDTLKIYYGAGDTSVCMAEARIHDIFRLAGL